MSAADDVREAIAVGCTRDDHDHVADHRAEVLDEAATEAEIQIQFVGGPDSPGGKALAYLADRLRRMADTPVGGAA
jgi:hypothetical protein